jgi:uncharacterized delta-60 repeat protein
MRRIAVIARLCAGLLVLVLVLAAAPASGALSDLDPTFGGGTGKVVKVSPLFPDRACAVALQADGKILVGLLAFYAHDDPAYEDPASFFVVRYNSDGSRDLTYALAASVSQRNTRCALAIQPDGKLLAVGEAPKQFGTKSVFRVTRYNTDGTLDATFGGGAGTVTTPVGDDSAAAGVALQPDGRILVVGTSDDDFAIARYDVDGALDPTFGGTGTVVTPVGLSDDDASSAAVQADGKILAGTSKIGDTSEYMVRRYGADGSVDVGFGAGGQVTTSFGFYGVDAPPSVLELQPDESIHVVGAQQSGVGRAIFDPAGQVLGSLVSDFRGVDGVDITPRLLLLHEGKIVVAGGGFSAERFADDLEVDTTFGGSGIVTTSAAGRSYAVAVQSDGRILAGVIGAHRAVGYSSNECPATPSPPVSTLAEAPAGQGWNQDRGQFTSGPPLTQLDFGSPLGPPTCSLRR